MIDTDSFQGTAEVEMHLTLSPDPTHTPASALTHFSSRKVTPFLHPHLKTPNAPSIEQNTSNPTFLETSAHDHQPTILPASGLLTHPSDKSPHTPAFHTSDLSMLEITRVFPPSEPKEPGIIFFHPCLWLRTPGSEKREDPASQE